VPPPDSQIILRLLLAAAIGGLLGAEREVRRKSAGFRTNILIAVGACVFTLVGTSFGAGDPSRVTAQIVTGIGFLGGGAILHSREGVQGMTTAAMIWVNAALGAAAGLGLVRLAIIGGGLTLAVLLILGPLEREIEERVVPRNGDRRRDG
jgi:putative Mg2+ transporter-C (MgtC) family protein